jgi:prepilin-type N-terminal cleavage/methylation domain-containing protein
MNFSTRYRRNSAFTLVELLAVIFIIALLSTLVLFAVNRAQRSSRISKTRLAFAAITSALEQYHNDFRTYPGLSTSGGSTQYTILAQALIGPGPATEDGADGPGFRIPDPSTGRADPNSKKWDSYLSTEQFMVKPFSRTSTPNVTYWALLDSFDNPIRYYPKRRNLNPKSPNSLADSPAGLSPTTCMFDARDGEHPQFGYTPQVFADGVHSTDLSLASFLIYIGDDSALQPNNMLDGNETLHVEGNFVLASPGPDAGFTFFDNDKDFATRHKKMTKSDDIFNFER